MSYLFTTIAWQAPLRTAAKFVLVSLADQANDEGYCWPSVAKLALRTSMSERTVQAALAELVEAGYLARHLRTGRSTYYQLLTPAAPAPRSSGTPADAAPQPPQISHPTPANAAPITTKELPVESSKGVSPPAAGKKRKARQPELTLKEWIARQPGGVWQLEEADPARVFAHKAQIPEGWVALAFKAFTDKHRESGKTYRDWGQAFRNAVAGNWEKVWFMHDDGSWRLTTVGHALDRVVNGGSP